MNKRRFWTLACVAGLAASAGAHEFFVMPLEVKEYKAGDAVALAALSTHYFTVGEELEPAEVNEVYAVKGGVKGPALKLEKNADRVWYETAYRLADNAPVVIAGNRKGGFYCLFTDGGYADGTRREVQAQAANKGKTVAKARYFAKYSKYYLNPRADDAGFNAPLGTDIEIIPVENPARYKKGGSAKFRVLYGGQPLAKAEITATYDYYDYKTANAYAQKAVTDAKGEAAFTFTSGGLWLVRVGDTRPSARPDTDEDNNAAIITFTVK